jgi:hypothetical protein
MGNSLLFSTALSTSKNRISENSRLSIVNFDFSAKLSNISINPSNYLKIPNTPLNNSVQFTTAQRKAMADDLYAPQPVPG